MYAAAARNAALSVAVRLFSDGFTVSVVDSSLESLLSINDHLRVCNLRCMRHNRPYSSNVAFFDDLEAGLLPAELKPPGTALKVDIAVEDYLPCKWRNALVTLL